MRLSWQKPSFPPFVFSVNRSRSPILYFLPQSSGLRWKIIKRNSESSTGIASPKIPKSDCSDAIKPGWISEGLCSS